MAQQRFCSRPAGFQQRRDHLLPQSLRDLLVDGHGRPVRAEVVVHQAGGREVLATGAARVQGAVPQGGVQGGRGAAGLRGRGLGVLREGFAICGKRHTDIFIDFVTRC